MKREPGYYWVQLGIYWMVAQWNAEYSHWLLPGSVMDFFDTELSEINETRLIAPDEQQG